MHRPLRSLAAVCLLATGISAADNVVFNGGFELGLAGWDCVRLLRPDANPKLEFAAPVIEEADVVSGKRSVRLPNPLGEQIEFYAREVRLKPSTTYVLSASVKSSLANTPVNVGFRAISPPNTWKGIDAKWQAGTAWQRFTHEFRTTADPQEMYSLYVRTHFEKGQPAADVSIDDFQVIEGADQPFRASGAIEVAAVAVKPLCIGESGALRAPTDIIVANYGTKPVSGTVKLRLIADDDGASLDVGSIKVEVPAGETRQVTQDLVVPRFGAFAIAPVADLGAPASVFAGELTAVGRYERKPLDIDTEFCVGANVGIGFDGGAFRARNGSADDYAALIEAMGCRLARTFDVGNIFDLGVIEAVEGTQDYRLPDVSTDIFLRHGIASFPNLGHGFLARAGRGDGWPAWLSAKCQVSDELPEWLRKEGCKLSLPPMEEWRRHVRTLAEHFKGRVRHFEIMNEPNLYLKPAVYVPYLIAAYEELKKVEPRNQVIGFCSTGDLGGQLGAFIEGCFAAGGAKAADVLAFHPYDAVDLSSPAPADRQIAAIRAMTVKAGRPDMKLWNTEVYYLNPEKHAHANGKEMSEIVRPRHVARRFLTDLGEGVAQSTPAHQFSLWRRTLNPGFNHATWITRWAPSGSFVAYNALARTFEGAKPLARHNWGSDTVCYVYERAGKTIAACWSHGTTDGLSVTLPTPASDLRVLDTLGNPLPAGPIRLTASPTYLIYEGKDRAGFAAALKATAIEVPQPLELSATRLVPHQGGWAVAVGVRNLMAKEMPVTGGIRSPAIASTTSAQVLVPALGDAALLLPVKLTGEAPKLVPLKLFSNGKIWDLETELAPAGRQASAGSAQKLGVSKNGAARHAAEFTLSREAQALRLKVAVRDATPSGAAAKREMWEQDCVEVFLDPTPTAMPGKKPQAYHDGMRRLFILPYADKGAQVVVWEGQGRAVKVAVDAAIRVTAGGYEAELTLPFAMLGMAEPAEGSAIGLEIVVDDADGAAKAAGAIAWNALADAYRNRFVLGFITF